MARTRSVSPGARDSAAAATFPLLALVLALALAGLGPAGCSWEREHAEGPAASLAGLQGVEVQVFRIRDDGVRAIVPEDSLRAGLERWLRAEGLRVLTPEERARMPDEPQLWVLFQAARIGPGQGYAFGASLSLIQSVRPARDPSRIVRAITWNSRNLVGTMPELSPEQAHVRLEPAWLEFVGTHRSANR